MVFGNRGKRVFISGEQGNKDQILRGTGEQRQYWGTGNIRKQFFDFWGTGEQANLFQGNKGICTPLGGPHYHVPHCVQGTLQQSFLRDTQYGHLALCILSYCRLQLLFN